MAHGWDSSPALHKVSVMTVYFCIFRTDIAMNCGGMHMFSVQNDVRNSVEKKLHN